MKSTFPINVAFTANRFEISFKLICCFDDKIRFNHPQIIKIRLRSHDILRAAVMLRVGSPFENQTTTIQPSNENQTFVTVSRHPFTNSIEFRSNFHTKYRNLKEKNEEKISKKLIKNFKNNQLLFVHE